ncbi:MAG: hypothetical protein U1G05_01555 [Kiritimatiellia bacterium]
MNPVHPVKKFVFARRKMAFASPEPWEVHSSAAVAASRPKDPERTGQDEQDSKRIEFPAFELAAAMKISTEDHEVAKKFALC